AGPLRHPLSRRFVRWALQLADYRSYRDFFSREYLASIGCGTANDPVYPDLAFSLPPDALPHSNGRAPSRPVIGGVVMRYDNERNFPINGETAYHGYLDKLVTFLLWLLEHDYTVRLFIGDALYDDGVIQDVKRLLVERGAGKRTDQILHEPMACVEDL